MLCQRKTLLSTRWIFIFIMGFIYFNYRTDMFIRTQINVLTDSQTAFGKAQWLKNMEETFMKQRLRINEVCQKYRLFNKTANKEWDGLKRQQIISEQNTIVSMTSKLAYCQTPKVGTSTWITHFRKLLPPKLQDIPMSQRPRIQAEFKIPVEDVENHAVPLESSFIQSFNTFLEKHNILSFTMVRHPFERLVSMYKSEIERCKRPCAKVLGLLKWYDKDHTWPSFVNMVLKQYRRDKCFGLYSVPCLQVNPHWTPFNNLCLLCDVSYSMIGRMESFSEHVKYIFLKSNATILIDDYSRVEHSSQKDQKTLKTETEKKNEILKYMSLLTKQQIDDLYQMYKFDFELFNYDQESDF